MANRLPPVSLGPGGAEIWAPVPPSSPARVAARIARALRPRWRRLVGGVRRAAGDREPPPRAFVRPLSDDEPAFTELEAIVFRPDVLAAIEREPPPLTRAVLDPPRLPAGVERFGVPPRRRPVRVYDVFPFSLELDLLELRLHELDAVVDVFVAIEATRGFGGPRKPLVLERNLARFERFRGKLVRLTLDEDPWTPAGITHRRVGADWQSEELFRAAMWRAFRRLAPPADSLVLFSDVDEIPPRNVVHWLREHAVPLPVRLRLQTLRYGFDWYDADVATDVIAFSPAEFAEIDAAPHLLRALPARVLHVRGSAHLTAFLEPLALMAKFCLTTEWNRDLRAYLEDDQTRTAQMIRDGQWFGRPMVAYDAERDPARLLPEFARANRARYARFWDP